MTQRIDEADSRPITVPEARKQLEEAQAEAQQMWQAAAFAVALGVRTQDRLAAAEMARDAAFSLWCDLTAMERNALGRPEST